MEVIRTIHPIGQGAFYTERFIHSDSGKPFNVVYDCGSGMCKEIANDGKKIVEKVFAEGDIIDLLFISHFHADHINGIRTLLDNKVTIKKLVIPYIDEKVRHTLKLFSMLTEEVDNEVTFIDPYELVEGTETTITEIVESDINPENDPISIDDFMDWHQADSGTKVALREENKDAWLFIPFCMKFVDDKIQELQAEFDAIGASEDNTDWLQDYKKIEEVVALYKDYICKNLNQTSLMMFSTPKEKDLNNDLICEPFTHPFIYHEMRRHCETCFLDACGNCHTHCTHHHFCVCGHIDFAPTPSCLYTGDITLKDIVISLIGKVTNGYKIGSFQVPHHGSKHSWNNDVFSMIDVEVCTSYFLSHGIANKYHHPNKDVVKCFSHLYRRLSCVNDIISTKISQIYCV